MANGRGNNGNSTRQFWRGGGSKITADSDCSHKIKRRLLLGIKAMTNLDSILKSRELLSPTKVHLVTAMVFPVIMYGCESWTTNKAEGWRIDAFELCYWRRLLRLLRVWVNSGSWWWTGRPGDGQGGLLPWNHKEWAESHNWVTELNWTELNRETDAFKL